MLIPPRYLVLLSNFFRDPCLPFSCFVFFLWTFDFEHCSLSPHDNFIEVVLCLLTLIFEFFDVADFFVYRYVLTNSLSKHQVPYLTLFYLSSAPSAKSFFLLIVNYRHAFLLLFSKHDTQVEQFPLVSSQDIFLFFTTGKNWSIRVTYLRSLFFL